MVEKFDGGPAYPFYREWVNERKGYSSHEQSDGMSLRHYFAAKAMCGLAANSGLDMSPDEMAVLAYRIADAMLAFGCQS